VQAFTIILVVSRFKHTKKKTIPKTTDAPKKSFVLVVSNVCDISLSLSIPKKNAWKENKIVSTIFMEELFRQKEFPCLTGVALKQKLAPLSYFGMTSGVVPLL